MSLFWRTRFDEGVLDDTLNYTSGEDIKLDERLILYDILGTEAHNIMLYRIGLLEKGEITKILKALEELKKDYLSGNFKLKIEFEDAHLNIEQAVTLKIGGEVGGKIHLARSRNDQVLVDIRLLMRDAVFRLMEELINFCTIMLDLAEENYETVMPGYTHMQHAQPITFSHWCLSYVDSAIRDLDRLLEVYRRINMNPLGAGALAGFKWNIKREVTTELLGFDKIQENTLDAISSRGEIEAEFISTLCLIMIHLSKIAEETILWSTHEFNFIELSDRYSTGSSIMPQKKNPDISELVRGRAGIMIGNLCAAMSILKGLPSGYNRDFQETKKILFESIDTTLKSIHIVSMMIKEMKINRHQMEKLVEENFSSAVDLSDLLVEKGLPFRTAYKVTAQIVKEAKKEGRALKELKANDLEVKIFTECGVNAKFDDKEIQSALNPMENIRRKRHIGGPAPQENMRMTVDRRGKVESVRETINKIKDELNRKYEAFTREIKSIISSP